MKPLLLILPSFLWLSATGQSIQLENLTYSKKDSRAIFVLDNVFKVTSEEPILSLEYDKSLTDVELHGDSLTIRPVYKVHYPERKSSWDGKKNELLISFITKSGKQDIKFYLNKLPHAFPSIMAQPENTKVDKELLLSSKKVEIATATPDHERFFTNYKVQAFELLVNNQSHKVSGSELNKDALAALTAAKSGDKITLQQVQTIDEGTTRKINFVGPTTYVLK
jgi:hypothetical protein